MGPREGMELDWNQIVEDVGPRLYRYFRARFSEEQASDFTQETLIRLVRKTRDGAFKPEQGNIRMYTFGIAHFVALEAHKTFFTEQLPEEEEPASEAILAVIPMDEILIGREEASVAREALRDLPPIQSEILILMIDEEMSLGDISLLLKIPVGTIKSHIFRAKQNLREILIEKRKLR